MVRSRVASIEKAGQRVEAGPTEFIEQPMEADLRLNTACRLACFIDSAARIHNREKLDFALRNSQVSALLCLCLARPLDSASCTLPLANLARAATHTDSLHGLDCRT